MTFKKELPPATGAVELVLLDGGAFTAGEDWRLHADADTNGPTIYLYDWCFFIHHKSLGRKILWDLGMSNDPSLYTPCVVNLQWPGAKPVGPRIPLVDQVRELGCDPGEIDSVIFSHAHWDHCRPVSQEFPNAKIEFGPGTGEHCRPGHIQGGQVMPTVQWDGRFFSDDPRVRSEPFSEIDGPWQAWGPFDAAFDYFGDGSFWVIQAPGHMQGNLAACARLPSGEHVLLGSDCCHSRAIFNGAREIANVKMPDGSRFCLHQDLDAALDTIERLRAAVDVYGMHLALAHDAEFVKEGKDETLMSILHPLFRGEGCVDNIRAGRRL